MMLAVQRDTQNSFVQILAQAEELLTTISAKDYQAVLQPHFSGSIGGHIRHILDHFSALQVAHSKAEIDNCVIDYNKRRRFSEIEKDPSAALQESHRIQVWLSAITAHEYDLPVQLCSEISIQDKQSALCTSTFQRELVFVASHAIHHYALVRIIRAMQGYELSTKFGYAPATLSHLREVANA